MNFARQFCQVFVIAVLSGCGGETGSEPQSPHSNSKIVQQIIAAAPHGWSLAEAKAENHGGTKLILVGPNPVALHWRDQAGNWHDDPIAKESLEIWVLPSEYREGEAGVSKPLQKIPPRLIFANGVAQVYALPSEHLNSQSEQDALLRKATTAIWLNTPYGGAPLSWSTWRADLTKTLNDGT